MNVYKIKDDLTTSESKAVELEDGMTIIFLVSRNNKDGLINNYSHTKKYIKAGNYMNFTKHSQKLSPYDILLTNPYFRIIKVEYQNKKVPLFIQKIWNWFKFKFNYTVLLEYKHDN